MPNNYNSSYTGQHNDQYEVRITDLENTRVNRSGDRFTGPVYIGNLNDNAYTDFNIQRLGTNEDTQNLFMCNASDGAMSHIWRVVNGDSSNATKLDLENSYIHINQPLQITKNGNTVSIGSLNAGFCHFNNSADIPFYFNKTTYIDGDLVFYGNGNKKLYRAGQSSSWAKGRDNVMLKQVAVNGYSPCISIKTTSGSWEIGAYNGGGVDNQLLFSYVTDSNYNSNNNTSVLAKITPAGAFTSSSKREYKENIQLVDYSCLNIINSIKVCSFNMKGDGEKDYRIGFIADDTDARVAGKNHDIMDLQNCIGVLIKAVQELSQEVEKLKKRLGE